MNRHAQYAALYSWLIVFILTLLLIYPALAYPIEEYSVDGGLYHVHRSVIFEAARADGWFYPRWAQPLNIGLGSPLFSFYPPMTYFAMAFFRRLGASHPLALRLVVAAAFLAAMTGAFALGLRLFRRADAALAGAVLFSFSPYLLHDIFGRGSPQGLATCLFPWLAWAFLRLAESPSGMRFALVSVLCAAIALMHTLTLLTLLPLLALLAFYAVAGTRSSPEAHRAQGTYLRFFSASSVASVVKGLVFPVLALAQGALLSAFYVAPFLLEQRYIQFENVSRQPTVQPALHPLPLAELLRYPPLLDAGFGSPGRWEPRLGWLHAAVLVVGLGAILLLWRRQERATLGLAIGMALLGCGAVWLQTASATSVWTFLPGLAVLQFRWRLLAIAGLATAVLGGYLLTCLPTRARAFGVGLVIVAGIGLQLPTLYPTLYPRWARFDGSPTVEQAQRFALAHVAPDLTGHFEFQPRSRQLPYTPEEALRVAASPVANLPMGGRLLRVEQRNGWLWLEVEVPLLWAAELHVLSYRGWVGAVDGAPVPLRAAEGTGYTVIDVPAGRHTMALRYVGTRTQRYAEWLSLLAVAALVGALLWRGPRAQATAPTLYLRPRGWLAAGLALMVGIKLVYLDTHTTFLRHASRCGAVYGAQVNTDVRFADQMRLCGYTLPRRVYRPGEALSITLYWYKEQATPVGADNFVHLLGAPNNPRSGIPVWGQSDKYQPADHPIHTWEPGKLYADEFTFRIEPDAPPGAYHLEIGWYEPTWERLEPQIVQGNPDLSVLNGALYVAGIVIE